MYRREASPRHVVPSKNAAARFTAFNLPTLNNHSSFLCPLGGVAIVGVAFVYILNDCVAIYGCDDAVCGKIYVIVIYVIITVIKCVIYLLLTVVIIAFSLT